MSATRPRSGPFRFPVQWVNRPHLDFRGYAGTVASGSVKAGDEVVIHPSGKRVHVARIVTADGDLDEAQEGDAITLTFAEEVDASRGDIVALDRRPRRPSADQIAAKVIWFDEEAMLPGRAYTLKCGGQTTTATVSALKYKLNVDNLDHVAGKTLELNEVGLCNLSMAKPLVFDPYGDNAETGSFILIDRFTNATVAAGMIEFGLRRATNVQWQELFIDKWARAGLKGQKPCVLWFTGLSGSGKSTIANTLEKRLHALGRHTYMLDGDNVRHGLNKDLGFTDADRVENIRRVAEAARLFVDAGLIVMVSFISPFRSERRMARELVGEGEFIEIFVDTPLEVCEARDPKGLYRKARAGLIRNFTGIDSSYEAPEQAELALRTSEPTLRPWPNWCWRSSGAGTWCSEHLQALCRAGMAGLRGVFVPSARFARVGIDILDPGLGENVPVIGECELIGCIRLPAHRQVGEEAARGGDVALSEEGLRARTQGIGFQLGHGVRRGRRGRLLRCIRHGPAQAEPASIDLGCFVDAQDQSVPRLGAVARFEQVHVDRVVAAGTVIEGECQVWHVNVFDHPCPSPGASPGGKLCLFGKAA